MFAPRKISLFAFVSFCTVILIGCGSNEPPPVATDTPAPTATPTQTPEPTATPTLTPTPGPLAPAEIFDAISPSVAFIDTPSGTGSGLLIADNYILTNAHVVWPFEQARVVFPDGSEFVDAPVVNLDLMADLAVIGPLDVDLTPLELTDGESLIIGTDVYLIGYPGEVESFPQPTITRGLISRLREWEALAITYFQSDATIAGGQSGGILVSEMGEVIGISGFFFSEAEFALVASAIDVAPRVARLIAGEDVAELGEWRLPMERPGRTGDHIIMDNYWENQVYILNNPAGTAVSLEIESDYDAEVRLLDVLGNPLIAMANEAGGAADTARTQIEAPYFVEVRQFEFSGSMVQLSSNQQLIPYSEKRDGQLLQRGDTVSSLLDYPGDYDFYRIHLSRNQEVTLHVDSILIDPMIFIVPDRDFLDDELIADDDSGGGLFGVNAELTYKAPETGRYIVVVASAADSLMGGYILSAAVPYEGAPTPMSPPPTPTPVATDLGDMALYRDPYLDIFSLEYPASMERYQATAGISNTCDNADDCFFDENGEALIILMDDLDDLPAASRDLESYAALVTEGFLESGARFESQETITTQSGATAVVVIITFPELEATVSRVIAIEDGVAFNALYLYPNELAEKWQPLVEYSFNSLRID